MIIGVTKVRNASESTFGRFVDLTPLRLIPRFQHVAEQTDASHGIGSVPHVLRTHLSGFADEVLIHINTIL